MKILHYALGFPPYRSGGLTKYCMDLMLTQREMGHEVGLLWPGQMNPISKKVSVRIGKEWNGIGNFELLNMLPVALDEGILDIGMYTSSRNIEACRKFLLESNPDVIHIHTLMGLPIELVRLFKELGISMIFTSHDYYGLCPKVTFFRNGAVCKENHECDHCFSCNQNALSLGKIAILQSSLYRMVKDSRIIKILRQRHRSNYFEATINSTEDTDIGKHAVQYRQLRQYYLDILKTIGTIHYNSSVAKNVYDKYISVPNNEIISISHRDIRDCRIERTYNHTRMRLTYLGPPKAFKGYNELIRVLDTLYAEGFRNFELSCYSIGGENRDYISHIQDGYVYSELSEIFDKTDLLVVPSQWYETFGFTVLEALSYGVPVSLSELVGAKDLLSDRKNKLFSEEYLRGLLQNDNWKTALASYNREICTQYHIKKEYEHCEEMIDFYRRIK